LRTEQKPEDWNQAVFGLFYLSSLCFVLLGFAQFKLYHSFRSHEGFRDLFPIVTSLLAYLGVFCTLVFLLSESTELIYFLLTFSISSLIFMTVVRLCLRALLKSLREKGYNLRHILVIGDGENAQEFARRIQRCRWMGFNITGFLTVDESHLEKVYWGIPVIGLVSDLEETLKTKQIDQVYCALSFDKMGLTKQVSETLERSTADFRIVPDLAAFSTLNTSLYKMDGIPVLGIRETPLQGVNVLLKRLFDIAFSSAALLMGLPMMLLIAAIIKATSKGPIFFRQTRVGYDQSEFKIIKFRSMPVDAENDSGPVWAEKNDGRATAFGSFLRRTSLDEWPQFFNVLVGSMSVVGPRPERPEFIAQFKEDVPRYMLRHKMKAGITGWAQVNGWRGKTSLTKRIQYDLHYIDNWSIWFDIKIILITIFKGFIHKNAY
jgi:Undecaprenyl-phosphate glucose phosphotransferase